MSAVLARLVAIVAAILSLVGLLLTADSLARVEPANFWLVLAVLVSPYLIGLASAVSSERALFPAVIVLGGCAVNASLAFAKWRLVGLPAPRLGMALVETCILQMLVSGLVVYGGMEGWKQARRRRAEKAALPNTDP